MWFSFDGVTFETHNTEAEAEAAAECAMDYWSDGAGDGWDELSTQVVYGRVTHAVSVETIEVTDDNRHLVQSGCDGMENHQLEKIVPDEYRCNICGGIVSFDGTAPCGRRS